MRDTVIFSYSHSLRDTCNAMQQTVRILRADAMNNPILVARTLLNRTDIHEVAAGEALEVFPCLE